MKLKALILACLILAGPSALKADFSMPMIDVTSSVTNTAASFVIWSSSNVTESAGNTISVVFPKSLTMPAVSISTCACVFMKFSMTPNGTAFTPSEVTVTSGSIIGQRAEVRLPRDVGPGTFYLRFDSSFGMSTPSDAGIFTVLLTESNGNSIESKGAIIRDREITVSATAAITGSVVDGGTPVGGALVFASTFDALSLSDDFFLYQEAGPRGTTITSAIRMTPTAKEALSYQHLSTFTRSDGTFNMNVPWAFGKTLTYYIYAVFSKKNGSVLETWRSSNSGTHPSQDVTAATSYGPFNLTTFQKIVP
jgi:hypothetical protein